MGKPTDEGSSLMKFSRTEVMSSDAFGKAKAIYIALLNSMLIIISVRLITV